MSKSRPIIILGHTGMLGQMVNYYFSSNGYQTICLTQRFEEQTKFSFIEEILKFPDAVVINCIGGIKQKTNDEKDLLWTNTILPLTLARYLLPSQTIIHPSTDCVFNGTAGKPYSISDNTDAQDSYGWSKIMGEQALIKRSNTLITRVSIIGPDNNPTGKGLMAWFFSNAPGSKLRGFTNHLWNGITTLEWCKQVERIFATEVLKTNPEAQLIQFATPEFHSKYELLCMFNSLYQKEYSIEAVEEKLGVDRRLVGQLIAPSLESQLAELVKIKF